jgi:hypothetical protein
MLNSFHFNHSLRTFLATIMLLGSLLLTSCVPQSQSPSVKNASNSTTSGGTTTNMNYQEPAYPYPGTFLQQNSTQTNTTLSLPLDFSDSFLVRGKTLSQYLRKLPNTTKFCLVGKYTYVSGSDKFLLLSGKPKSFTDTAKKTTEFFLQVEPANSSANQNDCNVYNLTNELLSNSASGSIYFSFQQLCTDCSSTVTSEGLQLYLVNGQLVPTISLSDMYLSVSGNSAPSGNMCTDSTTCQSRGYGCCLQGQCVRDGAAKPGNSPLDPAYLAAQEDVRVNPSRFILYPQYYFVCDTRPASEGGTTGPTTDPNYEAAVHLMELKNLYNCLNKVDGEFSYCTVKFSDVSPSVPANFSPGDPSVGLQDDINFSTVNPNLGVGAFANNIVKIVYGGQTLYDASTSTTQPGFSFMAGTFNDDLSTSQGINLTATLSENAPDDNLYLTYKADGTCERVGSTLARCTKTYIQNSADTTSTMYHDTSATFLLPAYADLTSSSVIVKVGGIVIPEDPSNWSKSTAPNSVTFVTPPFNNQKIEITYFVTGANADLLTKSRFSAQNLVNKMCSCVSSQKCNLNPVYNEANALVNYECTYPQPTSGTPPANQTVSVSSKNVPHRYYDLNGVNYDEDSASAPAQELTAFSYASGNVLKPSNVTAYTGFNEIYGSFLKNGSYARPAKMVRVKKDKLYDLLVTVGGFSTCISCGTDYYSSLQKIFPQSFSTGGGGYAPDLYESRKESNASVYRADDLLYGRACFVPATMIPWTHVGDVDPLLQRQARLQAQHFLFANGYNRDWYGFDYGSLIGSFDGVNWFSVGSMRRIKAKSSRLYLAVNAYFGDLNIDNGITVNVTETTNFTNTTIPTFDSDTDGAQCQKSHFCSSDNDCIKQLGYDYTCQNVSALSTNWPLFDANGMEVASPSVTKRSISSLIGGMNGQLKRCVYRGRGAPCAQDLTQADPSLYYNGSTAPGTLACSPNHSCQLTSTARFNDRISRFGNTPTNQNTINAAAPAALSDIVGLGARILGRPFEYYGTTSAPASVQTTLTANGVNAVCVPGKDVASSNTTYELNTRYPASTVDSSDKISGVGATLNLASVSAKYYNACPAVDAAGNYMHLTEYNLTATPALSAAAISQNLSTNLLDLAPLTALGVFSSTAGSQITSVGYQRNACLRAPGAACLSDFECGPSNNIAGKARTADLSTVLNPAEEKFWEEELICGNPDFKIVNNGGQNPYYDIKKNRCCRDFGKDMTVYTQINDGLSAGDYRWCDAGTSQPVVAGVNVPVTSSDRYSRTQVGYDTMTCDPAQASSTKPFALSIYNSDKDMALKQILYQYKTLDTINQRTCCTTHWVRKFASTNGGGNNFSRSKMQTIDKDMFRHVSWNPQDTSIVTDQPFECDPDNYANSSCEVKSFTAAEEKKYLEWAASLELIGIPQVAIDTNDQVFKLVNDSQTDVSGSHLPLNNSIKDVGTVPGGADFTDTTATPNVSYYSGASYSKFNMGTGQLKKVFSENEFNCCIPSNQQVPDYTNASQCCTGYIGNINNIKRCCLPDYTDLTVYLNRYVSSEGRGLPDSAYDPKTGYIKDPGDVKRVAQTKNLCCSGTVMTGVAVSQLNIPLIGGLYKPADQLSTSRRFNYRTDSVDNNPETGSIGSIFDAGIRWNNHVYCVPAGFGSN